MTTPEGHSAELLRGVRKALIAIGAVDHKDESAAPTKTRRRLKNSAFLSKERGAVLRDGPVSFADFLFMRGGTPGFERRIVDSHFTPAEKRENPWPALNTDAIRDDIAALKSQLADLLKHTSAGGPLEGCRVCAICRSRAPKTLREQVRDSPLASIAIAFIAGSIVGRMMR